MSRPLTLEQVSIQLDGKWLIKNISCHINSGEIACLLGPSGCGKTTILRSIIGFQALTEGRILLDEECISSQHFHLAAEQRQIGMVFQDFSLFPHLNINDNIAFGLRHLDRKQRARRVAELLELIALDASVNIGKRFPHELSGGQQQRVAVARALAPKPRLLLLDEPFSSIDADLRQQLTRDIRSILKAEEITALMVTHDQLEAFSMADKIGVMNTARLEQWGTPYQIYHQPCSRFVADFIGHGRFIKAQYKKGQGIVSVLGLLLQDRLELRDGQKIELLIRPDDIIHDDNSLLRAVVVDRYFLGAQFIYTLQLNNGEEVLCYAPSHHDHNIGESIGIRTQLEHCVWF